MADEGRRSRRRRPLQGTKMTAHADDRKLGMTLTELDLFVNRAFAAGVPGDTPIHATLGWSQQIEQLHTRTDRIKPPTPTEGPA